MDPTLLHRDIVGVGLHKCLYLRDLSDEHLGGEHKGSDGCGVLEGVDGHLGRVQDTCGQEIFVHVSGGVVTETERLVSALIGDNLHGSNQQRVSIYNVKIR